MSSATIGTLSINPITFANFYFRLHQKTSTTNALFDQSWAAETRRGSDIIRWSKNLLSAQKPLRSSIPLFTNFLDRLALLKPSDCQRMLCTAVLLSRREAFRHCIDGGKIRALQTALSAASVAAVLKSTSVQKAPPTTSDWQIDSLLGEALYFVEQVCTGPRQIVRDYIKIALPRQLPVIQSSYDEGSFESLLREVCAWYPELTWLFG